MRFITYHEVEQRLVDDRMRVVIVGEFNMRDFASPGTQIASIEDSKVYFNLLVDMFCFSVRLGMIGGRE